MSFLPTKVNAVLAVDNETVKQNIDYNLTNIPVWLDAVFYPNGFQSIIVSGGPSMEKYVKELNLKERMEHPHRTFVVFCVKHALPRLQAMGIEPDFCVVLDGRPLDEDSTHGVNRKSLFKEIPKKTIFLVASMTHPSYAKYLIENGARVMGWHTAVTGLDDFKKQGRVRDPIISGGTSSGTRCIGISMALGMREITLVGFDSCHHDLTEEDLKKIDQKGRPKYLPIDLPVKNPPQITPELKEAMDTYVQTNKEECPNLVLQTNVAKRFFSTGELIAQAQDFETMFSNGHIDCQFTVLDDGLVSHMYNNMANVARRNFSFIEYFKSRVPKDDRPDLEKRSIEEGKKKAAKVKSQQDFNIGSPFAYTNGQTQVK
jgi:hypothetical protein